MESDIEKAKRVDTVLGVIVATAIGFVMSLFANLYYGIFITQTTSWANVSHRQVYSLAVVFIALIGFLRFFIDDYKNDLEINRSLLTRFVRYFFYDYTPGKLLRIVVGLYLLFILGGFLVGLYFLTAKALGYIAATILAAIVLAIIYWLQKRAIRS